MRWDINHPIVVFGGGVRGLGQAGALLGIDVFKGCFQHYSTCILEAYSIQGSDLSPQSSLFWAWPYVSVLHSFQLLLGFLRPFRSSWFCRFPGSLFFAVLHPYASFLHPHAEVFLHFIDVFVFS